MFGAIKLTVVTVVPNSVLFLFLCITQSWDSFSSSWNRASLYSYAQVSPGWPLHRPLSWLWTSQARNYGSTIRGWLGFFKSMDSKEEMNMCKHWKSQFLEQSVFRNQVCLDSGLLSGMYRKLPQINKRKTRNPMGSEQPIDQEITEEKSEWLTGVWRDAQP